MKRVITAGAVLSLWFGLSGLVPAYGQIADRAVSQV
jgi:hypothetical protein